MAKRRRSPFGFGFFDDEMERMMEDMLKDFSEGFRGIDLGDLEKRAREGKSFVRGYSVTIGPDGKPIVREFGDRPVEIEKGKKKGVREEREPLVDVIEEKQHIKVIAELPGISKEQINLKVGEENLEIKVENPERKYYKSVKLPASVKSMSAKASYKNGVLEIILERKEPKKDEKESGHKIKIE